MEKVTFMPKNEGGSEEAIEFFVLEQTRINGKNYILVTELEDGDGEAFLLKDVASEADSESIYEMVENEIELLAVAKVFEEIMEDIEFETE